MNHVIFSFHVFMTTKSAYQVPCSKSRDAALAGMAVKVMQLESLLSSKQAELQRMGDTGQAWIEEACCLRDAVASTLAALGQLQSLLCHVNNVHVLNPEFLLCDQEKRN